MGKIIRGRRLDKLNLQIHATTAGLFADMLNPKMRGPNFRFKPEVLADMSFGFGYYPSGYSSTDKVLKYQGLNDTCSVEEYWKENAHFLADRLIKGAGINEMGKWDDQEH